MPETLQFLLEHLLIWILIPTLISVVSGLLAINKARDKAIKKMQHEREEFTLKVRENIEKL